MAHAVSTGNGRKVALIAGARGVSGLGLARHLLTLPDWEVITVCRERPDLDGRFRHVAVDLEDAMDSRTKLAACGDATHVFHCAYKLVSDRREEAAINLRMLVNLMDGVEPVAGNLRHVNLMHGTKWYGSHLGPYKTPAREDDPRLMPPMFYYDQHDHIVARQRGKAWTWSTLRPHTIFGFSLDAPQNLMMLLAVYAVISKALGLPLRFPGTPGCYRSIKQATEADLLSRAMVWVATDAGCANNAFNLTNGDLFRWENVWPRIARFFGLEPGGVFPIKLSDFMADKGPLWDEIVRRHGLRPLKFEALGQWAFGDNILARDMDDISSMTKARRFGFHDVVDSEEMFLDYFRRFQRERIIPA